MRWRDLQKRWRLVAAPESEPVTRAQAKAHCQVVDAVTDWDSQFDNWIASARESLEAYTDLAFVTQTWELSLRRFPLGSEPVELWRPPVQSIASITYLDTSGNTIELNSSDYVARLNDTPATLSPLWGESWPTVREQEGAVLIRFVAGYSNPPKQAQQAILMMVGHWFANRESVVTGTIATELPLAWQHLVSGLKWR